MKSKYVELMASRKEALRKGDESKAQKLHALAMRLVSQGKVSDDELLGGAYI